MLRIIGIDGDVFLEPVAPISLGVDFKYDFILATGGNLSRIRDCGTASAGLDLLNAQLGITGVADHKFMYDFSAIDDGCELEIYRRHFCDGSGLTTLNGCFGVMTDMFCSSFRLRAGDTG